VLYCHHVGEISGAETSLWLLLRHLDRGRVTPLFAGPAAGPFAETLAGDSIPVLAVPFGRLRSPGGIATSVRRLRTVIREHHVDLVHANGPQTNLCAGLAARLAGIPAVWHARNLMHEARWDADRTCSRLAARIICNSDAIRERFRGSRAWAKSVTILNAVDPREFGPDVLREPVRREWDLAEDEPAVGIVGRVSPGKGHEHFVEAARQLTVAGVAARFFVVGAPMVPSDGGHAERLRRAVAAAGLEPRLRFTGRRSDIPRVMRALDVLVMASDAEACGRVLVEAMASGTAIVATGSGGTPELVRDGQEGLLVAPRDPGALARAVRRLVEDPGYRERLGKAGMTRARTEFGLERHLARTLEVYRAALGGGPAAP
jgi:glycosyltransferase involved in cell wall biosynthesis